MEQGFGMTAVVTVTVICYLAARAGKLLGLPGRWIPVFCGVCGGALGVLGYYTVTGYPAEDLMTAVAVGIESGLAATGAHQAVRRLGPGEEGTA